MPVASPRPARIWTKALFSIASETKAANALMGKSCSLLLTLPLWYLDHLVVLRAELALDSSRPMRNLPFSTSTQKSPIACGARGV